MPANGIEHTNPEIAALLCGMQQLHGLKGDCLTRARELGCISKTDNHHCHAAKTHLRNPSEVRVTSGRPSHVDLGSLSAPTVTAGGPTSDFKGCQTVVNNAKDERWAAKGITGKGPAAKNAVRAEALRIRH